MIKFSQAWVEYNNRTSKLNNLSQGSWVFFLSHYFGICLMFDNISCWNHAKNIHSFSKIRFSPLFVNSNKFLRQKYLLTVLISFCFSIWNNKKYEFIDMTSEFIFWKKVKTLYMTNVWWSLGVFENSINMFQLFLKHMTKLFNYLPTEFEDFKNLIWN